MPQLLRKHRYVIGLGSNLGDRGTFLRDATTLVALRLGPVLETAPHYETAPIGAADQPFLNTAVLCETEQAPADAIATLLAIETALGRIRKERWGNRVIDLDLLLWRTPDGKIGTFNSPALQIPHPHLLERDFALVPAAVVAPDWTHPLTDRSLRDECQDRGYELQPRL